MVWVTIFWFIQHSYDYMIQQNFQHIMSKGGVGVNEILQLFLKVAGEVMFGFMYIFEVESENSTYEEKH